MRPVPNDDLRDLFIDRLEEDLPEHRVDLHEEGLRLRGLRDLDALLEVLGRKSFYQFMGILGQAHMTFFHRDMMKSRTNISIGT